MIYINRKCNQFKTIETVEELENDTREQRKYNKYLLNEYKIADRYASYYFSQRPCKQFKQIETK